MVRKDAKTVNMFHAWQYLVRSLPTTYTTPSLDVYKYLNDICQYKTNIEMIFVNIKLRNLQTSAQ